MEITCRVTNQTNLHHIKPKSYSLKLNKLTIKKIILQRGSLLWPGGVIGRYRLEKKVSRPLKPV